MLTSLANFTTSVLLLRVLGLADFGRASICILIVAILQSFFDGALLAPMSVVGPKLVATSIPVYRGFLAANALVGAFGSSIALWLGVVPLGLALNAMWLPDVAMALAATNLSGLLAAYFRRFHFVFQSPRQAFVTDLVRYVAQLVCLGVVASFFPRSTVETSLYSLAVGALLGAGVGLFGYGATRWSDRFSRAVWPRHWNFIRWMTPTVALESAQSGGVLLLGGAIMGETALGAVRSMQNLANIVNLPVNALQNIAPTMAATALRRNGIAGMRQFLSALAIWSGLMSVLASLAVYLDSDQLIRLTYGLRAQDDTLYLLLFLLCNVLLAVRLPLTLAMQSRERPGLLLASSAAGAVCGIAAVSQLAGVVGPAAIPGGRILIVVTSILALLIVGRERVQLAPARR